jgi:hypothetical protein
MVDREKGVARCQDTPRDPPTMPTPQRPRRSHSEAVAGTGVDSAGQFPGFPDYMLAGLILVDAVDGRLSARLMNR